MLIMNCRALGLDLGMLAKFTLDVMWWFSNLIYDGVWFCEVDYSTWKAILMVTLEREGD